MSFREELCITAQYCSLTRTTEEESFRVISCIRQLKIITLSQQGYPRKNYKIESASKCLKNMCVISSYLATN